MASYRHFSSAFRTDPGTGQRGRAVKITDPLDGTVVVQQVAGLIPNPLVPIKVAQQESTNARMFPYIGSSNVFGATAGAGASTVRLNSTAMGSGSQGPLDPMGLVLVCTGPTNNLGQMRLIKGWTGGVSTNRDVDLVDLDGTARTLPDAVGGSDTYELVYPVLWDSDLVVKTEFSAALASAPSAEVRLWFVDLGQKPDGTLRMPLWTPDVSLLTIVNLDRQGLTSETSFYHGGAVSSAMSGGNRGKGWCGVKIEHVTKPASGTMSTWLGST